MRDTDPRIVEEIVSDHESGYGTVTWHRCVICKMQWKPRTPAVHHERCGIGNLQHLVEVHIHSVARERRRAAERVREEAGRRNEELGRWRTWASGILGPISRHGSDAALRFRLEDKIGSGQSAVERGLRAQIAALEEKLAEVLARDREFDALKTEVTEARGKGGA